MSIKVIIERRRHLLSCARQKRPGRSGFSFARTVIFSAGHKHIEIDAGRGSHNGCRVFHPRGYRHHAARSKLAPAASDNELAFSMQDVDHLFVRVRMRCESAADLQNVINQCAVVRMKDLALHPR
jgi:hypothetical protein